MTSRLGAGENGSVRGSGWIGGLGWGLGGVDDDVSGGRFDPLAASIETSESADGAKDGEGGGRLDYLHFFEDLFYNDGDVFAAELEKAGGARVAVERIVIDVIFLNYLVRMMPFDEIGLDGFAVPMAADLAFAAMAFERRKSRPFAGVGRG